MSQLVDALQKHGAAVEMNHRKVDRLSVRYDTFCVSTTATWYSVIWVKCERGFFFVAFGVGEERIIVTPFFSSAIFL